MATSTLVQAALAANIFNETSVANAKIDVKASSAIVYFIQVDNTANGAASYLKLYNTNTVTVGTTVPDDVILVPASVTRVIAMPAGVTFGTGLSVACVTAGGTAGTTSPVSAVIVRIAYT